MQYSSGLGEKSLKNMSNEDNDYNALVRAPVCLNVIMPPCKKRFSWNSVRSFIKCTERIKCYRNITIRSTSKTEQLQSRYVLTKSRKRQGLRIMALLCTGEGESPATNLHYRDKESYKFLTFPVYGWCDCTTDCSYRDRCVSHLKDAQVLSMGALYNVYEGYK
jgi:hypothetical protein